MTARAIELHMDITTEGSARLEIVEVDDVGQEFVVDLVGPEAEVRGGGVPGRAVPPGRHRLNGGPA